MDLSHDIADEVNEKGCIPHRQVTFTDEDGNSVTIDVAEGALLEDEEAVIQEAAAVAEEKLADE